MSEILGDSWDVTILSYNPSDMKDNEICPACNGWCLDTVYKRNPRCEAVFFGNYISICIKCLKMKAEGSNLWHPIRESDLNHFISEARDLLYPYVVDPETKELRPRRFKVNFDGAPMWNNKIMAASVASAQPTGPDCPACGLQSIKQSYYTGAGLFGNCFICSKCSTARHEHGRQWFPLSHKDIIVMLDADGAAQQAIASAAVSACGVSTFGASFTIGPNPTGTATHNTRQSQHTDFVDMTDSENQSSPPQGVKICNCPSLLFGHHPGCPYKD